MLNTLKMKFFNQKYKILYQKLKRKSILHKLQKHFEHFSNLKD